jgi:hypothetical protein
VSRKFKEATMRWVLWLNTVAETVIAIGMFSAPGSFFPGAAGTAASIARAFSFAILAVAFISLTLLRKETSAATLTNGVAILTFYHLAQLIAQFVNAALRPPLLVPPVIIHTVFSTLFVVYLVRLIRSSRPPAVR